TTRSLCRGVAAAALALGAGTPAAAQLPFTFTVRAAEVQPGAPGLQSFALAEADSLWLLVGGRRNGFHLTSSRQSTFPSQWANDSLYVVDVAGARTWRAPLPARYRFLLRVNNMQYYQEGDTLYFVGGYGSNCDTDDRTCYQTYPNLTAIHVPSVVRGVQARDARAIEAGITTVQDERMRVTGGGLRKIGDTYYLVLGQNYDSIYKGAYTGKYTHQVRTFRIGRSADGAPSILDYRAYVDPRGRDSASQWHRRDLNVVETVEPGGSVGIAVYGGVFTPNGGAWVNPMYVSDPPGADQATVSVDQRFAMRMSQYECAQVLMYDPVSRTMYTTLLGGISLWYYPEGTNRLVRSSGDNFLPWIQAITTLARDRNGVTTEVVQPASMQMPARLGANAVFVPARNLATWHGTHEVLDYSELPGGDRVLVGWMYGGIRATADQASQITPTDANDTVYEVWLNRPPQPSRRRRASWDVGPSSGPLNALAAEAGFTRRRRGLFR
ncbi:MAG TPA: hypothetical protein VHG28_07310, partial [Longimicrobiaceae bacterium]|nr:hypothetical protein [Longimicrobiaceae bacterium]